MDVQTQQRRLQQDKFDSQLKNFENDNKMLELRLTNKDKDIEKLKEKFKNAQVFRKISISKIEKQVITFSFSGSIG